MGDFHVHTTFSDGKNTPEEMLLSALDRGMDAIGFSDHSYTWFDEGYCIPQNRLSEYRQTVEALKRKYAGKIRVYCGIEQDLYSRAPAGDYDYRIGSVHYLLREGVYLPVDESPELLRAAAERYYGGDYYAMAEDYFQSVSRVPEATGADLIGHFDLIAKFNEGSRLFDEHHPRYIAAWQKALDALIPTGIPFEINTGAISRGYRSIPYPAPEMQAEILRRGGRLVWSSDSHRAETLCFGFPAP